MNDISSRIRIQRIFPFRFCSNDLGTTQSDHFRNTSFPDFSGLAFANEKISLKRYPSAFIAMISRRFCDLKYPIRTKRQKQTIPTFGAFKKQAPIRSSRCMLRVKILEHAFSIIILFNLKNSVGIEWLKASWNSSHKLFKVSNYYGPTTNRRIAKDQSIRHMQ